MERNAWRPLLVGLGVENAADSRTKRASLKEWKRIKSYKLSEQLDQIYH